MGPWGHGPLLPPQIMVERRSARALANGLSVDASRMVEIPFQGAVQWGPGGLGVGGYAGWDGWGLLGARGGGQMMTLCRARSGVPGAQKRGGAEVPRLLPGLRPRRQTRG